MMESSNLFVTNDGQANYLYQGRNGEICGCWPRMRRGANEDGFEQANMECNWRLSSTGRMSLVLSHFDKRVCRLYRNDGE